MAKLITVVGNSGVGKTTFTRELCRAGSFATGLEQQRERPFQALFSQELNRYALANQVDYLLFRADQELEIRQSGVTGVLDGGLDQDFYIFTHLFYNRGYLTANEFQLCERVYRFVRFVLPPPDLIIRLAAPLEVVAGRYAGRKRGLEIARIDDLAAIEKLLDDWLSTAALSPLLTIDASSDDLGYTQALREALEAISNIQ